MSYKFTFNLSLRLKQSLRSIPPPEDDCCICLELSGSDWVQLDCKHVFHRSCLLTYLETSVYRICPLCRSPLESEDSCTIL